METTDKKLYQAQVLALKDEVNTLKKENQRLHAVVEQRNNTILELQADKIELIEVLRQCKLALKNIHLPKIEEQIDLVLSKYKGKISSSEQLPS